MSTDQELIEAARSTPISIPRIEFRDLERRCVAQFAKFHGAGPYLTTAARHRLVVNLARHKIASYDRDLEHALIQRGLLPAALLLRQRVLVAITAKWPKLADECHRQYQARAREWAGDAEPRRVLNGVSR